jgi:hypothetical protein
MEFSSIPKMYKMIGAAVALSVVSVPVIVQADASNPVYTPKKKKASVKPRAKKKAVARRPMARPAPRPAPVEERVESIAPPAPEPVYTPAPVEPAYVPPAPEPVVAAPAAVEPVAKSGGNGLLIGLLGAAAVAGGILLATSGDDSPASGG